MLAIKQAVPKLGQMLMLISPINSLRVSSEPFSAVRYMDVKGKLVDRFP